MFSILHIVFSRSYSYFNWITFGNVHLIRLLCVPKIPVTATYSSTCQPIDILSFPKLIPNFKGILIERNFQCTVINLWWNLPSSKENDYWCSVSHLFKHSRSFPLPYGDTLPLHYCKQSKDFFLKWWGPGITI